MAAQPNLAAMMARQLISRMSQGGGQPPSPGGGMAPPQGGPPPQGQPSPAGAQISQQLAELQGADPQSMLKLLKQVKSILVALYPRSAFTVPGVARNVAQSQKYIDNAIKEAEQASATAQAVQPPIANSTGITPQAPDEQTPGLQQFSQGAQ